MPYLADNAYLAIGVETTPGVAVIPAKLIPLVEESMKTVVNHSVDKRMKGINWGGTDLIRGNRTHEGTIKVLADPDTLGYFLNMFMTKGTSSGSVDGYTHPFTVGTPKTYTIDVKKGNYVQRYVGAIIEELKFGFDDGKMVIEASVKAQGQIGVMSLGAALSGSVTTLILDDEYDINPTRGLVANDILVIGDDEVTVLTVAADGVSVTFAATSLTHSAGVSVHLKPQSIAIPTLYEPFFLGNILVGLGAAEAAATTAAGSRSTATPVYDLSITLKNPLFANNGTGRMDPTKIVPLAGSGQISLKQTFESEAQRQAFLDRTKQAITIIAKGKFIKADYTTQEKLTLKFNNVKLSESENPLKAGELIFDEQTFEVLYDASDGVAMTASLINRTATY